MILNTLEIQNFGIYNGCNELELTPKVSYNKVRPVILVGGKNGAGKSTMFEAIKLCLYGKKSLEGKNSQKEYLEYLDSRINWHTKSDETTFIKISFSIYRDNINPKLAKEYKYDLIREWYKNGSSIKEDFSIYQDDVLIELESEFWEDFIEEIIPQGVINLFFFDGEKIQGLAEGSSSDLKKAIKSLLNLAIIPSLSGDLKSIYKRYLEQGSDKDTQARLSATKKELEKSLNEREKLQEKYAIANTKTNATKSKLETLETKLKNVGGEYYEQRENLKAEEAKLRLQLNTNTQEIAQDCEEMTPFLLAPKLTQKVTKQLDTELLIQERKVASDILSKKRKDLDKALKTILKQADLSKPQAQDVSNLVSGYTSSWLSEIDDGEAKYNLTTTQISYSKQRLTGYNSHLEKSEKNYTITENINRKIKAVQRKIESASTDDVVINIHNEIKEQSTILGQNQKTTNDIDELINKKSNEITLMENSIEKLYDQGDKNTDHQFNFDRINQVRTVLSKFETELTNKKVAQLEDEILSCYGLIHRKTGFISRINIDPETFEVTMFDKSQKVIPVDKLSAGEKQVYATSVLWALSKLSGQTLPMVIDTPLGRLDAAHRDNLIENFFPNASHQVIILSTDTEIDANYFEKMQKNVSHTYSIDFNLDDNHSSVGGGYLFESQGGVQ